MATTLHRLTSIEAKTAGEGLHNDGGGLILQVGKDGARSWIFRYRFGGRRREMGLGPFAVVGLARARELAQDARQLLAKGSDPIEARKAARAAQQPVAGMTFAEAARQYIAAQEAGWKGTGSARNWRMSLKMHAIPHIGRLDVGAIGTDDVLKVLQPIWLTRNPTASKVRGRIESILDWAKVNGQRTGENPARWRGNLKHLLAKPSKVHRVTHLEAMPYAEVPAFVRKLREGTGITARCLELTILTVCRVNESTQAQWCEIDEAEALWRIPGERTKSGRVHVVPLCRRALAIIAAMKQLRMSEWVFPGMREGRPLTGMAQLQQLRRMRPGGLTVHGFRSSFKDWASERTSYPDFLSEMALGHISGDKVREAYARSELLAMRRKMLDDWARWCNRRTP